MAREARQRRRVQVILAGATLPDSSLHAARWAGLLSADADAELAATVSLGEPSRLPPRLRHRLLVLGEEESEATSLSRRLAALTLLLRRDAADSADAATPPRSLVFCASEASVVLVASALRTSLWGVHRVVALLPESGFEPTRAVHAFRDGGASLLLATAEAERGMDWPGVRSVYSLSPVGSSDAYLHRAGRAGRLGDDGGGCVTTLCSAQEAGGVRDMLAALGCEDVETVRAAELHSCAGDGGEEGRVQALEDLFNLY
jgi:superfamily II DNA/RNA helicase